MAITHALHCRLKIGAEGNEIFSHGDEIPSDIRSAREYFHTRP